MFPRPLAFLHVLLLTDFVLNYLFKNVSKANSLG